MRPFSYIVFLLIPTFLSSLAYNQNHETRMVEARYSAAQNELQKTREALRVYSTEWAYLNRPDRLRELVQINDEHLGLFPMGPEHFATLEEIPFSTGPHITNATASFGELNDQ